MPKDPLRLPPLDLLQAFEAAARHLSFTRAADERHLTQSAVSRQIQQLEEHLGSPLFRRRHRAIELTEPGQRLADTVRRVLGELRVTVAEIRAPRRRELLSLTTTPGLASLWLIPRLASFTATHPELDVRIDASLETRALAAEGIDLAIRYGRVGTMPGEPLFVEASQPACAPALVRQRAKPLRKPADLRHHTLLQVPTPAHSGMPLEWQSWLQAVGLGALEPAATLSFTNYNDAVAAAVEGQGVVLGRRPLIDALLKRGSLVTPFKEETASARGYFVLVEPAASRRPGVQALVAWLHAQAVSQPGG